MLVSRMTDSTGGRDPPPKLEGVNERRREQGKRNSIDVNLDPSQIPQNKVLGTTEGQVGDSRKNEGKEMAKVLGELVGFGVTEARAGKSL